MDKKHVYYFDWLRLISAIGVIYMHVAAGPLRSTLNLDWHLMNIVTCFAFTAVPLFLMMSGYLILNSEKTADVSFLFKKRLPHLAIPLITWTVVAVLYRQVTSGAISFGGIFEGLVSAIQSPAWVHLWYMYSLITLYIISPLLYGGLKSLSKKGHILVFSLCCLFSAQTMLQALLPEFLKPFINISILNDLFFLNGTLAIFILGYYLGNFAKKIPNLALIGATLALLAVIIVGTYKLTVKNGQFDQTFQYQYSGFEVVLAACVFLLFKQNFNKPCRLFKAIPIIPLSLPIYLMHNILLSFMGFFVTAVTFWDTIYITAINLVICFVVMKTAATIKPLCYLVTGMNYKTACETCNWIYTFNKFKKHSKEKA